VGGPAEAARQLVPPLEEAEAGLELLRSRTSTGKVETGWPTDTTSGGSTRRGDVENPQESHACDEHYQYDI